MENHLNTNKIPTAEEFYKQTTGCVMNHRDVKTAMIEFAKLHVEAALKEAEIAGQNNWGNSKKMKDSILNAYPLENVK